MQAEIPFLDLGAINGRHRDALETAFQRVLDSGWYILGKEVEAFEREFADGFRPGAFPITEAIHKEVLSLPMGPHLNEQQVAYVCAAIRSFFERA